VDASLRDYHSNEKEEAVDRMGLNGMVCGYRDKGGHRGRKDNVGIVTRNRSVVDDDGVEEGDDDAGSSDFVDSDIYVDAGTAHVCGHGRFDTMLSHEILLCQTPVSTMKSSQFQQPKSTLIHYRHQQQEFLQSPSRYPLTMLMIVPMLLMALVLIKLGVPNDITADIGQLGKPPFSLNLALGYSHKTRWIHTVK
jgi:hypothetical protein